MRARDVMTQSVVTVPPDADIHDIARLLLKKRISAVPVVDDDDRVLGIVSEGDLMRRPENEAERHSSWWLGLWTLPRERAEAYVMEHGQNAADVMTRDVAVVDEDTSVAEIAALLEARHIKRVPVVRDDHLVGIVSRANLLHGLATAKKTALSQPTMDDRSIRDQVADTLEAELGITNARINVVVHNGNVDLWGMMDTAEEKRAVFVAAQNTPGVREVRDHVFVPTQTVRSLDWGV
jgi:CBS domain-containing protein